MKHLSIFALFTLAALVFSAGIYAESSKVKVKDQTVKSLIQGLNSGNKGLQVSSALRIFELIERDGFQKEDFKPAMISLMRMVRQNNSEEEKLSAALALYSIGSSRGIRLIGGLSKFDDDAHLRKIARNLYYQYHLANGTMGSADL